MEESQPPIIIEVTTQKDGLTAVDVRGRVYKIESIMLGVGRNRKPVKVDKGFLSAGNEYRAEVLKNGKLNIL